VGEVSAQFRVHGYAAARRRSRRPPAPSPVTREQVPEIVMLTALELAGGDRRRIRVLGATTVLVVNQPKGARR
jgi:hypothetical protein